MTTIKNFFALSMLFVFAFLFNADTARAQSSGDANQDFVVNFSDLSNWTASRNLHKSGTGTLILASSNTYKSQLIAEVRGGKIARVLLKELTGTLVLEPTSGAPCSTIHCYANQVSHCYQVNGGCVCVCGAFVSNYPNN